MDRFIEYEYSGEQSNMTIMMSVNVARALKTNGAEFKEILNIWLRDYIKKIIDIKNGESQFDEIGSYECLYKDHEFCFYNYEDTIVISSGTAAEDEEYNSYLEELVEIDSLEDDEYFSELYGKATDLAEEVHAGQKDKGGKPYIEHPKYVSEHLEGRAEKIVGLLHDVVEDSSMTIEDLRGEFPDIITDAVEAVTKREDELYASYIVRLRTNPIARRVKIEDMKHNMDLSRIPKPRKKDRRRVEKYAQYLRILETDYFYEDIATGDADPDLRMVEYQIEGYEFHRAMRLIRDADKERVWKAIEVNNILKDFGMPVDVQIAALLYCCIEPDVSSSMGIANQLGMAVFGTYLGLPWNYDFPIEDKTDLMDEFLPKGSRSQKLILLAIAIAELREYEYLAYKLGQKGIFDDKDEKLRVEDYYLVMADGFDEFEHEEDMRSYYWTLQNLFKDVFVTYHVNKERTELYQGCDYYCWVKKHYENGESIDWTECQIRDYPEDEFDQLTREDAEALEDEWNLPG